MLRGRFRPRLIPTLASLVGVCLLMSLSVWQLQRHVHKNRHLDQARAAAGLSALDGGELDPERLGPVLFRHVSLTGRFTGPLLLEGGRAAPGGPGYAVLQRFEADAGFAILVDRGELPRPGLEEALAALSADPPGSVEGQLRPLPEGFARKPVDAQAEPLIWPRRGLVGIHAHAEGVLPGVYLVAGRALEEGEKPKPAPVLASGYEPVVWRKDSLHYAAQWATMALILAGLWGWTSLDRKEPS